MKVNTIKRKITKTKLIEVLKKLSGKRIQKFHPYSSKNIDGVPLWKMSRENKKVKLPEHIVDIKKIKILKEEKVKLNKMDFDDLIDNANELLHALVKLKPTAAKGTYIKSIHLSSTMSPAIALDPKAV
mgnify:CR=1 FL=1